MDLIRHKIVCIGLGSNFSSGPTEGTVTLCVICTVYRSLNKSNTKLICCSDDQRVGPVCPWKNP